MLVAIDFDGTCVKHDFPKVGEDIGAAPVLRALVANNHRIILWTVRGNVRDPTSNDPDLVMESGSYLDDAVNWSKDNNINIWGSNENHEKKT